MSRARDLADGADNVWTDADNAKLDTIETSATADQTAAEIRTLVESASDSNVFTDADHTKLNAIEASADVTDATNVAAAGALMTSGGTVTGTTTFGDGNELRLGADNDMALFHSSGVNHLRVNSGTFKLRADDMRFTSQDQTERMRLDSSGNLQVGQTSNNAHLNSASGDGLTISSSGEILQGTTGESMILNRRGSDGTILRFRKDGSTVGQLNSISGPQIALVQGSTGLAFYDGGNQIYPTDGSGNRDATIDLGYASSRFKDGFFSNELQCYYIRGTNDTNTGITWNGSDVLSFSTGGSEAARFNSSQTLLIGKTAEDFNTVGFQVKSSGQTCITRNQGTPAFINRKGDTGGLIDFRDDNANCGVIGTVAGDLFIANAVDVGLYFDSTTTDHVAPCNIDGSKRHAAIDMGSSSTSFRNYYGLQYRGAGGHTGYMHFTGSHDIRFVNNGSERARFWNEGSFSVGTSTNNYSASNGFGVNMAGAAYAFLAHPNGTASGTSYFLFSYNGGAIGSISQNGTTAVSYNTGSDRRLKSNIQDSTSASDKIDAIQVRQFDWNADNTHQDYGLIAQELQPIAPNAVTGNADSDMMMGVDYSKLVPMLLKEVQSLRGRVAALEAA